MNREERQLVDDLFERLSKLENAPRDPDALAAIAQGLSRAPNAVYALVQTVLVQDEALKRASARIEELEQIAAPAPQEQQGGFLDSMRGAILGQPSRGGSVPNVRAGAGSDRPVWNTAPGYQADPRQADPRMAPPAPPPPQQGGAFGGGGGSFLGTAAAAAAGVIGGSLLMNSIGGLMGGAKHGFGDQSSLGKGESGGSNPWSSGGNQSKGDLAREAGVNDIGRSGQSASDSGSRQGAFDQASNEGGYDGDDEGEDDYDSDDFDGGDSDFA